MISRSAQGPRELELTRVLDAPRALVFKVWTEPRHLAKWWGPHGFTAPECTIDLRPGGTLRIRMTGHGFDNVMDGEFVEIVEPERLVFKSFLRDETGAPYLETLTEVTFSEEAGKTNLRLLVRVVKAGPEAEGPLEGMTEGWNQSLERLAEYVRRAD
jgi:uncharacterized protein YndB with AHSA1/START domain